MECREHLVEIADGLLVFFKLVSLLPLYVFVSEMHHDLAFAVHLYQCLDRRRVGIVVLAVGGEDVVIGGEEFEEFSVVFRMLPWCGIFSRSMLAGLVTEPELLPGRDYVVAMGVARQQQLAPADLHKHDDRRQVRDRLV